MLVKVSLNIPFIYGFNKMGLPAFYGAITTTILGFFTSSIISMVFLKRKYKVNFEDTLREVLNIVFATILMFAALYLLKFVLPFNNLTRINSIMYVVIYAIIGALVYIFITYNSHTISNIFGKDVVRNIKNKL